MLGFCHLMLGILLHVSKCQLDYLIIHLSKWKSSVQCDPYACITPLKTNIEPENHLLEKESHLPNLHFQFPSSFSEGLSIYQKWRFSMWSLCLPQYFSPGSWEVTPWYDECWGRYPFRSEEFFFVRFGGCGAVVSCTPNLKKKRRFKMDHVHSKNIKNIWNHNLV